MKKMIWILVYCVWISTYGAAEESEKMTIASLPEGISIELVGLRSYSGSGEFGLWWRPDGGQLKTAPDKRFDCCSWSDSYLFLFNIEGKVDCSFKAIGPWDNDLTIEPTRGIDKGQGFQNSNLHRFTLRLGEQNSADIRLAVATGGWNILEEWPFSSDGTPYDYFYPSPHGAIMRCPEQKGSDIIAEVTQTIVDQATRLVLFDRDGNQYISYGDEGGKSGDLIRYIHYFKNINKNMVDHLEFQARPYDYWITFQNVSMQMGQNTHVEVNIKKPGYLLPGEILPNFDGIKIDITEKNIRDRRMLVCFFDYEQRPSRNCILQLSQKADELKAQEISVIAIHISKIEQGALDEWVQDNNISFPIGMIEADPSTTLGTSEENIRFNWGVKSLPWLILTDKNHVVTSEGFSINELDEKITEAEYTYYNEIDIPTEAEQLRLFLLKGYISAKSVINDVRIEYQTSQIPVNPLPLSPAMREKLNIDATISDEELLTSTDVCEYIQKNNKERWVVLYVGKTAPTEDVSYRAELVRTEDTPRFKVFDGQYILDYSRVNDSFTNVGRAILELNNTGFFESIDLLSERAPVRFYGYWPSLMPDDVLSSPQVDIEAKPEKIGKLLTYKVSALLEMGDVFEISYWLSPERSCLPVKTEVWRNGRFTNRLETKEFIELEDGRWAIKSILQRNYINRDDQEELQELVNYLHTIRKIELYPEIDEDVIFNTSPDSLPRGADICDNRFDLPLRYINDPAPSLIDKPLPNLKNFTFNLGLDDYTGGMILVCFFDYEQRPSRNCVQELNKKADELKAQEISVIAIHISKIENDRLNEWVKENNISFPVGVIKADEEQTKFNWGVKSLPWLILTDKEHKVTAEGFGVTELDEKLVEISVN